MRFKSAGCEVGHVKVGELAAATGVSVRLLRYYEEQGLLTPLRTAGGHRFYAASAPAEVRRIRLLLAAGLPTRRIRELAPCFVGAGPEVDSCVWDLLREQLAELDARIEGLEQARGSLRELLESSERVGT